MYHLTTYSVVESLSRVQKTCSITYSQCRFVFFEAQLAFSRTGLGLTSCVVGEEPEALCHSESLVSSGKSVVAECSSAGPSGHSGYCKAFEIRHRHGCF